MFNNLSRKQIEEWEQLAADPRRPIDGAKAAEFLRRAKRAGVYDLLMQEEEPQTAVQTIPEPQEEPLPNTLPDHIQSDQPYKNSFEKFVTETRESFVEKWEALSVVKKNLILSGLVALSASAVVQPIAKELMQPNHYSQQNWLDQAALRMELRDLLRQNDHAENPTGKMHKAGMGENFIDTVRFRKENGEIILSPAKEGWTMEVTPYQYFSDYSPLFDPAEVPEFVMNSKNLSDFDRIVVKVFDEKGAQIATIDFGHWSQSK